MAGERERRKQRKSEQPHLSMRNQKSMCLCKWNFIRMANDDEFQYTLLLFLWVCECVWICCRDNQFFHYLFHGVLFRFVKIKTTTRDSLCACVSVKVNVWLWVFTFIYLFNSKLELINIWLLFSFENYFLSSTSTANAIQFHVRLRLRRSSSFYSKCVNVQVSLL